MLVRSTKAEIEAAVKSRALVPASSGGVASSQALVVAKASQALVVAQEASAKAAKEKEDTEEARLFELVRMVRDWIERTFCCEQEAKLKEKGRLCARFQVDLGAEMTAQLQAYVAASFALRLVRFRTTQKQVPGRKAPKECVEVLLSPEARELYAEKNPDATTRKQAKQTPAPDAGGLVDVDAIEDENTASLSGQLALPDDKMAIAPSAHQDQESTSIVLAGAVGKKGREAANRAETRIVPVSGPKEALPEPAGPPVKAAPPKDLQKAFGKRAAKEFLAAQAKGDQPPSKKMKAEPAPQAPSQPPVPTPVRGTGSVWEKCAAREVPPGTHGLVEAKDALDESLAKRARGGLHVIKAEKEAVSWLKGLLSCEVSLPQLRETKLGVAVNEWRKHPEPYISGLAVSLLSTWKRAWREADRSERKGLPSTSAAAGGEGM